MCISPNTIKNPYHGVKSPITRLIHDTEAFYIRVPCGVCKECIALKQMEVVQRVQMEAMDSFLYFSTLTYNNDFLPRFTFSNGIKVPFADVSHLQNTIKRIRNNNLFTRPFRYFAVSERGSSDTGTHRPHFHILWFLPRYDGELYSDGLSLEQRLHDVLLEQWSVNLGSKRKPHYEPLCTYRTKFYRGKLYKNYDTHFVVPSLTSDGVSSVAFYVCKYLMKQNDYERRLQQAMRLNLPEDEYEVVYPIIRSQSYRSPSFGLGRSGAHFYKIWDYLRSCVVRSDESKPYPQFFPPDSVDVFPMCSYYLENPLIFDMSDWMRFKMDKPYFTVDDKSIDYKMSAIRKFESMSNFVDSKDLSINFNFLFDD